jgi:hypothetical protein
MKILYNKNELIILSPHDNNRFMSIYLNRDLLKSVHVFKLKKLVKESIYETCGK